MLVRVFISACVDMLLCGIRQSEKILINAQRINNESNMDMAWLLSILYSLYQQLAACVEQLRRFYQFFSAGKYTINE